MNEKEIIEKIENNKLDVLELIEIINEKNKYNFTEKDIWEIEDNINYQIEELNDILKLENIKVKMSKYNMNIDLVNKIISRRKPLKNFDIHKFDKEDVEYYIYDGFDMLTHQQRLILLKKANKLKIEQEDIKYLLEQIQECKEDEEEKYILNNEVNSIEKNNSLNLFNILFSSNKKENIKKKSDYEPYQFEEEELEEDDYYYEDVD